MSCSCLSICDDLTKFSYVMTLIWYEKISLLVIEISCNGDFIFQAKYCSSFCLADGLWWCVCRHRNNNYNNNAVKSYFRFTPVLLQRWRYRRRVKEERKKLIFFEKDFYFRNRKVIFVCGEKIRSGKD